jgi:hypothetical protein
MATSTVQFITQMKLRELQRQRLRLREAYRALGEGAGSGTPAERLRHLHDGLGELAFAGQPLHPDVANLDVLLYEAEAGVLAPDVLDLWRKRLEDELAAGRLRAEFVYLFGALLEEWSRAPSGDARLAEEGRQARERLVRDALAEPAGNRHEDVLEPLFAEMGEALNEAAEKVGEAGEVLGAAVPEFQLSRVLEQLARNIYQPPAVRREARRFAANKQLSKELADALTILAAELHTWDWPGAGLAARALWTRNKWRLYLAEDLPTACLLEVIGDRWVDVFDAVLGREGAEERRARLKKLLDLNAPQVIIENERRMLQAAEQHHGLGLVEERDVWADTTEVIPDLESSSIVAARLERQRQLRSLLGGQAYDDEENGYGGASAVVALVNAEVRLARATFPDRPLYVVKADLRDFYASIPHDVLLTILRRLGVGEADRAFFARFLAPPLAADGGAPAKARRGVPMAHTLSTMLAELLLRLLEKHVRRHARVRIVRLVDDLCILALDAEAARSAWQRLEEFCTACGLGINLAKSGAVCLGGAVPEGLPAGRPRWGMLELDETGRWHVHGDTFEAHLVQTQERVLAAGSVLSRVQLYNANVKYLLSMVALGTDLGDEHRASAEGAVRQFHQDLFGPDGGIVSSLRGAIRERFQLDAGDAAGIPEAWVYWPITAGGLGLRNPLVVAGQYAAGRRKRRPVDVPRERGPGWNVLNNDWAAYYRHFLEAVTPVEPAETKVMQTLVKDFIARGAEISAGRQQDLKPYWRWVLCTYGPQILQRFGTFRFLITELVPLQLISGQLVQDSSLGEADTSPPADDDEEA